MKNYLTGVLFLISLTLLLASCNTIRQQGYQIVTSENYPFLPVFGPHFEKSLYAVDITLGNNSFTSMAVIKYIPENKAYRLVFLSETGMQLLEMEISENGGSEVYFMTDFLNKKKLVKKLLSDYTLLFPFENATGNTKVYTSVNDTNSYMIRIKENGRKDYFFTCNDNGPIEIHEHGCAFGRTSILIKKYENHGPSEIKFAHRLINFHMSLKQINYSEWK